MTGWVSEPLSKDHHARDFDCTKPPLNLWLQEQALRAQDAGVSRTYVWTTPGDYRIAAYYSLAPTEIRREEISRSLSGGSSTVPAYLLARLALDRSLHGQGLGGELLFDALEVIVKSAKIGGGRLIVVDALDEDATRFYLRHDFQPVKDNPQRLVLKVATVRKNLES